MMDDELMKLMKKDLKSLNPLFISAVTGLNIQTLKDKLWEKIKHGKEEWK
jgi:50S ribosomal subunit-associated GTPase HflX